VATVIRFSGQRLTEVREGRGWRKSKLARRAAVREQQIIRWESGQNVPSADAVAALASALGIEISDLFERSAGDEEEDEADMLRIVGDLERLNQFDLADTLRARVKRMARRPKELV